MSGEKKKKKYVQKFFIGCLCLTTCIAVWWIASAPPDYLLIAPAYNMSDVPKAIKKVTVKEDHIALKAETLALKIPGCDEIVFQEHLQRAFATGMDGWIWKVDLPTGKAKQFVDPPLMPAGAHIAPGADDKLYFCVSRLYGVTYPSSEMVGVYELEISTKTIRPLLTRVPLPPEKKKPISGNQGTVFTSENRPFLKVIEMTPKNSRQISLCNDLDISSDGERIYFSEPFDYPKASMGKGAFYEAITLGHNGRLWCYDLKSQIVSLIAQNYNFIDGVLLEERQGQEESILITETTKFRILRFYLKGKKAGKDEVLWHSLPGMPDGLDRDKKGRIWTGLIKKRSKIITWLHRNPWIKPFFLRLPKWLLPVPKETGILGFSSDAAIPLYYTKHDGSKIRDISVVVAGTNSLYLPSFDSASRGVYKFPYPDEIK